ELVDPSGPCEAWTASYDHPAGHQAHGHDQVSDMVVSPSGDVVYMTGASWDGPMPNGCSGGDYDFATVAIAASGERLWSARLGFDTGCLPLEVPTDIAISPDGSRVFVTGHRGAALWNSDPGHIRLGPGVLTYLTVAYDATTGEELWNAVYAGPPPGLDIAHAVEVSPDGSAVLVTGESAGASGMATIAYDAESGHEIWTSIWKSPLHPVAFPAFERRAGTDIAFDADGRDAYIAGWNNIVEYCPHPNKPGQWVTCDLGIELITLRVDVNTGEIEWLARTEELDDNTVNCPGSLGIVNCDVWGANYATARLFVAPDGKRLYLVGFAERTMLIRALDPGSGYPLWSDHLPIEGTLALGQNFGAALAPDGDRLYVSRVTRDTLARPDEWWPPFTLVKETIAVKTKNGLQAWDAQVMASGPNGVPPVPVDIPTSVVVSPDSDHVYVSGFVEQWSAFRGWRSRSFSTVSYDAVDDMRNEGAKEWEVRYNSAGPIENDFDSAWSVALTPDGKRFYVGGDFGYATDAAVADLPAGEENWVDFGLVAYDI
ncbi:MAG: hypothetical protein ACRDH9_00115, partial [Actinomycetota bacterium]